MKIDGRTLQDIENRIEQLAKGYVPEWNFSKNQPDIGSVIAILFAGQLEENIEQYNQVFERYHTEFVNMLNLSLQPAKSACAVVMLNLIQDTVPGTMVLKGTKLLAEGETTQTFETSHNLYVTNSRLRYAFMTQTQDGKILPLLGDIKPPKTYEFTAGVAAETETEPEEEGEEEKMEPFYLFGEEHQGIQQNICMLYHSSVLDMEGTTLYLSCKGGHKLLQGIAEHRYSLQYVTAEGLVPVEEVEVLPEEETLVLRTKQKGEKVLLDQKEYGMLAILAMEPITENVEVGGLYLSSLGEVEKPDYVNNGTRDLDPLDFEPFGETLALYKECYIGHDRFFGKPGAQVKLEFQVSYGEHREMSEAISVDEELKVIKRKPRTNVENSIANCYAEDISLEYFNGIGWKKLPTIQEGRYIFKEAKGGSCCLEFVCPEDWQETTVGGDRGKCLRMQLLRSDNCYFRPCEHHYPRIQNLTISYSYEGKLLLPERVRGIAGTRQLDMTQKVINKAPYFVFQRGEYQEDALYLGFSKPMEDGPISLLFQLEDGVRYDGIECRFECSTSHGFQQMRVLDHTAGMSKSGIVLFLPPSEMAAQRIEGKKAYWIRITRIHQKDRVINPPKVVSITLNAVEVRNIETRPEEEYFIDEVASNMTFHLGVPNILDVDLWVNELGRHTEETMLRLYDEMPDRVRLEKDILGNITSFYVKWEEVEQFGNGHLAREYILDRLNMQLFFGDGIHSEIPRRVDDVAFRMVIRCCNGQAGNVAANSIQSTMENLMFIDTVNNPRGAFGGSNIESIDSALKRGANILSGRRRLVSLKDYEREILSYSDSIEQVQCVAGVNEKNEECRDRITFVLLLKDYLEGSYSFHNLSEELKQHLLEKCEMMIHPKDLCLAEPVFVSISVDVWLKIQDMDDGFEVQNEYKDCLEQYLDAVGRGRESGWKIGTLPEKSQIRRKLNSLKTKAKVQRIAVTAGYTDDTGTREMDLEDVQVSPFMIPRNGTHKIHLSLSES